MVRLTPPTPPASSTSKPTTLSPSRRRTTKATYTTESGGTGNNNSIFRSMRDTGTVGAVANAGSDLSYDLSSTSSAIELNDDNDENNEFKKRPPNEVLDDEEDDDDDFSLDDDIERRGKHNINSRKNEEDMENMAVVIQDMHQLEIARDDHYEEDFDDGNIADYDDDGSSCEYIDSDEDDNGNCNGGKGELDLEQIAEWIKNGRCTNIVVLSGAGISCAAGIPDFRTPGSGLYDNLEKYNLPYPEAVFDLSFYQSNPLPFISLAKELWPGIKHSPTISHSFLSLLSCKNLLLRNYTQNIDGLELLSGVKESEIVECHGHFRTSACIACGVPYDGKQCKSQIVEKNEVPICPKCGCLVKPDIVFFGESLPVQFKNSIHSDLGQCDMLIVMGTSLKVAPVSLIPEMVNSPTPRVLFNRELVGDFVPPGVEGNYRDVFEEGDCDDSIRKLCSLLGWEKELLEMNEKTRIK